jgi:cell division protein FtsL
VLGAVFLFAVFGVVVAHVLLTQRQFRLDGLEQKAATEEARYERLRLQVAELEAPDRVIAAAQQLGMVPPATVTYVSSTRATPTATRDNLPANDGEWATVKPHLVAARP